MFNVYDFDVINAVIIASVTLWNQKHNLQSTVKNSDNKDFTTDFNQTYEPSTYHLLTDHITEAYKNNKQTRNLIQTLNTDTFKFECFNLGNLHVNQTQIYTNELKQLFIPDHENLHIRIIKSCHSNWVHNHREKQITFYQLNQHYWWPIILTDVKCFISNYNNCNQYKTFCQ